MAATLVPMAAALIPLLRELWTANIAMGDPALKALALKAMALKMVALAGTAYGAQYLATANWVNLAFVQANGPIKVIDTLDWLENTPVIGYLPFESLRTMLVNYFFMY